MFFEFVVVYLYIDIQVFIKGGYYDGFVSRKERKIGSSY
jgi:hypothetical protein